MNQSAEENGVCELVRDIRGLDGDLQCLQGINFQEFLKAHHRYPVIAITGQSGVGKSVFTEVFAQRLRQTLATADCDSPAVKIYTELPQLSPYLAIIKASRDKLSDQDLWIKNQYLFLSLDEAIVTQAHLESRKAVVVMDFALTQVKTYGALTIKGQSGRRFMQDFDRSFSSLPKPDLLVHVAASGETVLGRLAGRGNYIDEEIAKMTMDLNELYNESDLLEKSYQDTPRLTVSTDQFNMPGDVHHQAAATHDAVRWVMKQLS